MVVFVKLERIKGSIPTEGAIILLRTRNDKWGREFVSCYSGYVLQIRWRGSLHVVLALTPTLKLVREIRTYVRVRMNLNTLNDAYYPYILRAVETSRVWCGVLHGQPSDWIGCWLMCRMVELLASCRTPNFVHHSYAF